MSVNTNIIHKIYILTQSKIEFYHSACGLCKLGEKLFPRSSFARGDKFRSGQTLSAGCGTHWHGVNNIFVYINNNI